eukprot:scaffold701_cov158-Amphora_coffeaeformis.AAC.21
MVLPPTAPAIPLLVLLPHRTVGLARTTGCRKSHKHAVVAVWAATTCSVSHATLVMAPPAAGEASARACKGAEAVTTSHIKTPLVRAPANRSAEGAKAKARMLTSAAV